jgi:hypothetical protein
MDHRCMGVQAELHHAGEQMAALPDPSDGTFDAAGDFDRLMPVGDSAFPVLGQVEPHGELWLDASQMAQLLSEIDRLLPQARPGPERRGLLRLRTLALRCAELGGRMSFLGD